MHQASRRQRSVSPLIRDAVILALDWNGATNESQQADPTASDFTNELTHTLALQALLRIRGAEAVVQAGHRLGHRGDHPILRVLADSLDPSDLFEKFERLEPLLHLGNRTSYTTTPDGVDVVHVPRLNDAVDVSESLFVCGAQVGMLERLGCEGLRASFHDSTTVWPIPAKDDETLAMQRLRDRRPASSIGWTLTWTSSPSTPATHSTGSLTRDIGRLVLERPSRRWTLQLAAREVGVSTRTLQRSLSNEGMRFADILVRARLGAAEELLARTSLPIGLIAMLCGFSDPSHLSSAMRRISGATPSDIRTMPEQVLMFRRASGR